jgi:2-iminoacetate synthase
MYNPKSLKAEEFIDNNEILETLAYAEENKNNDALIDALLEKARPVKTDKGVFCSGLTHREASVLLACENPEKIEKMYKLAAEIKNAFYGNRIVIFAPLYLSNYCITMALIRAVRSNDEYDTSLVFCGENAYKVDKITTVKEIFDELTAE